MTNDPTPNRILPKIQHPADVALLTPEEKTRLAEELRETIVRTVAANGGHLASNLGTVELTIAMHRCFESPKDKFVFDVGHQTY
ncbi:MAG: 1-deoxy-D-xylulose-5-phosphate synthase, partial [Deltaproteobacteria bacterium]|nr:1-deoxy-D-xylulose-5-phosphate synthase [Deltaproteobacteria bacterium]